MNPAPPLATLAVRGPPSTIKPTKPSSSFPSPARSRRYPTDKSSVGALICARAEVLHAAVVVVARHTKGRIKEAFLGSVSAYVTRHCKSPVVVVHDE